MVTMSPSERMVQRKLDPHLLPNHVGIIMDGNGRWARQRGLPRTAGHKEGLTAAKRVVKAARSLGIPYLSLYTFSTENWKRAQEEVNYLMGLIAGHLRKEFDFYRENDIRVLHSGDISGLPGGIQEEIHSVTHDTRNFSGMTVNLAINYGGRNEISRASRRILRSTTEKIAGLPEPISREAVLRVLHDAESRFDEEQFSQELDHPEIPDADLIIRSGGEQRLSNFLIWQCSYAELQFDKTLWPDWDEDRFYKAMENFQHRCRRFGGT